MKCRRLLTLALRLIGAVEVFAFGAVVMPRTWMDAGHAWLGFAQTPEGPVFDSVMRQVSFTYGMHGIALWLIASDVSRYRPLVVLSGFGYLAAGPVFFAIDSLNDMPWPWLLGNGGACVLVGVVVLGLLWGERAEEVAARGKQT